MEEPVEVGEPRVRRRALRVSPSSRIRLRRRRISAESRTARVLDVAQRLPLRAKRSAASVTHGPHSEHDHADGVRDDVVQLAGDTGPLLGDSHRAAASALPLGPWPFLGLLGPLRPLPRSAPLDQPAMANIAGTE